MSLKAEIETWVTALEAYEAQDFDRALSTFDTIADSSKILFNIGLIHATLGAHEDAVRTYREATRLDPHLAIAYFQCGVSNFLLGRYGEACGDFDEAYQHMRENTTIDYEQLGLKFRLYSCEILFNRGLSMIYMGQAEPGMNDLAQARTQKQTDEHGVIDEAFVDRGDGYTVFSIPVGVLYRPSEAKVKNIKTRDYLGKARLVAATEERDAFTGFTGSTRQALDRVGPVSTGPNGTLPIDSIAAGVGRSASASAALPSPDGASPGLRRRPTDNSASVTIATGSGSRSPASPSAPALIRSQTVATSTTSRAPPLLRSSSLRGTGAGAATNGKGLPTPPLSQGEHTPTGGSPRTSSLPLQRPSNGGATTPPPRSPQQPRNSPVRARREADDEFDDVYDHYGRIDELLGTGADDRKPNPVALWAQKNARPSVRAGSGLSSGSLRRPTIVTNGGPNGNGSVGRKGTLRSPLRGGRYTPATSRYEEEEGYGSGEDSTVYEVSRIRVKLHFETDVRGMSITPDLGLADFVDRVEVKFGKGNLKMRFKDEDGALISLVDESDWESAMDAARETANGRAESKLEVFVE